MFEQLLGSKTRYRLLQLFLHHPDSYYYVRQLTRILDTQINSVRRELLNLESIGFVRSYNALSEEEGITISQSFEKKSNSSQKKFFRLNTDFLLYPELKALFMKEQLVSEKDLARELSKVGKIHYLALTGVFTGVESEIPTDMLIVGTVDLRRLAKAVSDYEKILNKEINYTVFSYKEFTYRKDINDRFLYNILNKKKIVAIDELDDNSDETVMRKTPPSHNFVS